MKGKERKRGTAKTADLVAFLLHLAVGARTTTATTVLYCTVAVFAKQHFLIRSAAFLGH